MRTYRIALLGAVALATVVAGSAFAASTTGSCAPTKVKFIASDPTFFTTTSTTFTNLPQSVVNFTQGGTKPSCVIVTLSANPSVAASDPSAGPAPMAVRVLLDGDAGLPGVVNFSDGSDQANQTRSFDFIFPSVAPGDHTVRVQFKASAGGGFTDMNRHNVIVHFAP